MSYNIQESTMVDGPRIHVAPGVQLEPGFALGDYKAVLPVDLGLSEYSFPAPIALDTSAFPLDSKFYLQSFDVGPGAYGTGNMVSKGEHLVTIREVSSFGAVKTFDIDAPASGIALIGLDMTRFASTSSPLFTFMPDSGAGASTFHAGDVVSDNKILLSYASAPGHVDVGDVIAVLGVVGEDLNEPAFFQFIVADQPGELRESQLPVFPGDMMGIVISS